MIGAQYVVIRSLKPKCYFKCTEDNIQIGAVTDRAMIPIRSWLSLEDRKLRACSPYFYVAMRENVSGEYLMTSLLLIKRITCIFIKSLRKIEYT
jgi:hypothetical protein